MQEWHYDSAADLDNTPVERLKRFPREPDLLWYAMRSSAALALRAWLRTYHRFTVEGRDLLPEHRSFVMVANHTSHLDALCLLSALPLAKLHRAFPAAAADYFFVSLPRIAASAILINALPFHRESNVRQSLKLCRELLANPGNILILFPEGTRSTDGNLRTFKPGIGSLLAGTDIPVVPCYLDGASRAFPKGAWLPRPRRLRLRIGPPLAFPNSGAAKENVLAISTQLRDAVLALSPHHSQSRR